MSEKFLSPIEDIIEDAKQGKMFILVDDEDRENEGDLVIPAQMADKEAINFMAKYGRGLICLTLTKSRIETLGLPPMARHNSCRHQTAFTVSIEAREGVTTGISAADRACTIAVAIDEEKTKEDIVTPGHVFPLEAREGGVLVRAGHTEAAIDIAVLAGLKPAGVICEIMNDDGTMARLPDLIEFAKKHNLKVATIADLIKYRRRNDKLVSCKQKTKFTSKYGGEFDMYVYVNTVEYAEHIVLAKGDIGKGASVPVRMHAMNVLSDVLGDTFDGKSGELQKAMKIIENEGCGVLVLLREPNKSMVSQIVENRIGDKKKDNQVLRDYGIGAQILLDLGVKKMKLITNSRHSIIGLDGYGLEVEGIMPIK
ncbi:MAG: 3,4-dihydroxy-2-butanone-4-phosphate synthase [Alphaproteobacteria bacterium CG11_big_fil_rev_8_21_14_0_20_39_49]|nr:MAG: 3,4-dihydroxy-2-butanone-4-phosphate synthase [Alphaproteobacteria bacterium CG11_big_fil_rev_8_21_14_0_20_39_49]